MYPLDKGRWGPTVRISQLREELNRVVELEFIGGYRNSRRVPLARYAVSGRLRGLAGIYVESSTFMPAEADIAFLGLARALGTPVLTYIRDAYQLFSEYDPSTTWRRRLARAGFRPSVRALAAVSTRLAFPSRGLADAVSVNPATAVLIPPGSPPPVDAAQLPDAHTLLYVGNGRLEAQGAPRLIKAVSLARRTGLDVRLTIVSRPGEEPLEDAAEFTEVIHAEGTQIVERLGTIVATVIPRPMVPYNDLAVPVKLYDYLSFGRPLMVTNCTEQARVVTGAECGLVVGDKPEQLAEGIARLMSVATEQRQAWGRNAHAAALANSWGERAHRVLTALEIAT
jgi:glycosyltransferase involved in cell wall biosynthesis